MTGASSGPRARTRPGESGAQAQRTDLAWARTALSCAVVTLAAAGLAVDGGPPGALVMAVIASAAASLVVVVAVGRAATLARPTAPGPMRARSMAAVSAAVVLTGLLGLVTVLGPS